MASHTTTSFLLLSFLFASLASCISAHILCEDLPANLCAFAVSSTGMRCILEKEISSQGQVKYQCQTSQVIATEFAEWVETDDCVHSCGVDRFTVGISSDALVEKGFVKSLCSYDCQNECSNVVDLYENLSAGEGIPLSRVCEVQSLGATRREMRETPHFASLSGDTDHTWESSTAAKPPRGSFHPQGLTYAPSPAIDVPSS